MRTLRNEDYTDRELLHIVNDCSTTEGWASTSEIEEMLAFPEKSGRVVATRMSWMVRYGYCQRHKTRSGVYRLTPAGRQLMNGEIDSEVESLLAGMSHGDRVMVMRVITQNTMVRGPNPAASMMRREYLHNLAKRNGNRRTW